MDQPRLANLSLHLAPDPVAAATSVAEKAQPEGDTYGNRWRLSADRRWKAYRGELARPAWESVFPPKHRGDAKQSPVAVSSAPLADSDDDAAAYDEL